MCVPRSTLICVLLNRTMHVIEMCDYFRSKLYFVALLLQYNIICIHFLEIFAKLIIELKDYRSVIINACFLCTRSYGESV